jgi:hypothetical protein
MLVVDEAIVATSSVKAEPPRTGGSGHGRSARAQGSKVPAPVTAAGAAGTGTDQLDEQPPGAFRVAVADQIVLGGLDE